MRLIVEVQAVADQLFQFDLGRSVETPVAAAGTLVAAPIATSVPSAVRRSAAALAPLATMSAAGAMSARTATAGTSAAAWSALSTFAGRPILAVPLLCLLFSHFD